MFPAAAASRARLSAGARASLEPAGDSFALNGLSFFTMPKSRDYSDIKVMAPDD